MVEVTFTPKVMPLARSSALIRRFDKASRYFATFARHENTLEQEKLQPKLLPKDGLQLRDFVFPPSPTKVKSKSKRLPLSGLSVQAAHIDLKTTDTANLGNGRSVYIETKGCQMNVADSEVVRALLYKAGFTLTASQEDSDVVLINTCAIRDKAEQKVWQFLRNLRGQEKKRRPKQRRKIVGLLGCMAERLKSSLLTSSERLVDAVVGPDAYRSLPLILASIANGQPGAVGYNVQLSAETYGDITPMRESESKSSAFVAIARGCNNMCSFCIVPYTRGPERSRPVTSIVNEVLKLSEEGCREVVLLGQNVNSYNYLSPEKATQDEGDTSRMPRVKGFGRVFSPISGVRFPELLNKVADVNPEMRIRFTSPHPKDFPDELLDVIATRSNVCKQVHMPAQSGSSAVLARMNRRYTREAYIDLVDHIREVVPGVALSSDFIAGFCGETEEDHRATLSLLRHARYEHGFFFAYSKRDGTAAARRLDDDLPLEIKQRRLRELLDTFHLLAKQKNVEEEVDRESIHCVLVEGLATRVPQIWPQGSVAWTGRTDTNKRVVFKDQDVPLSLARSETRVNIQTGEYYAVKVVDATSLTLFAEPIARTSLSEFHRLESCYKLGSNECDVFSVA